MTVIPSVLSKNGNCSYLLVVCYNVFNRRECDDHVLFNKNKSMIIAYPASSREVWYEIPDSVTVVSDWAFSECRKLTRITIPDSVYEIGEGAFYYCTSLTRAIIPEGTVKSRLYNAHNALYKSLTLKRNSRHE